MNSHTNEKLHEVRRKKKEVLKPNPYSDLPWASATQLGGKTLGYHF
jgi:hypothetical protein